MKQYELKKIVRWFAQIGITLSLICSVSLYPAKGKKVIQPPKSSELLSVDGQIPVSQVIGQVSRDRQELQALRDRYMQEYVIKGIQGDCVQLTRKITNATIDYVNTRIAETIKKIGPAPTKFSVFTMGSLARDESGFFTDLEIGILVTKKDQKVLNYFKKFSQVLADRFFLLGEHPDVGGKGLRIDEADNAPDHLRWWARYASPEQIAALSKAAQEGISPTPFEGSRIFVATPQEFADLLDPDLPRKLQNISTIPQKEKNLAMGAFAIARNIRHLYGDKTVFDKYMKAREKYLQGPPQDSTYHKNRREELSYYLLKYDAAKHGKPGSAIAEGKLGDIIDIKGTLYRFPEEVLTSLGFLYNVKAQNTIQVADELVGLKRMSPEWGNALKELMNFTMCLRLRKQMILGKQGYVIPVTQKGYDLLKQNLSPYDLKKLVPGQADSIITPEISMLLNTKYLPLEKRLLETLNRFTAGERDAFLKKMNM
jgi:hypothetical protein